MNRSKRLFRIVRRSKRHHLQLFEAFVFFLLILDILTHGSLILADGRDPKSARPKMLADVIAPPPRIYPRDMNGASICRATSELRWPAFLGSGILGVNGRQE